MLGCALSSKRTKIWDSSGRSTSPAPIDIKCCLFKAGICRAISEIACSKLLNQSRLKLYHYISRPRLQLGRGSSFYMRVEADDRTRYHRKQRRAQCAESSDHCTLASAGVTFVQDVA